MNDATTNPEPRPADPSMIRFDRDCFEQVGVKVVYSVSRSALHSGPAHFDSRDDAEAYARKTGRAVNATEKPVMRRVRWY